MLGRRIQELATALAEGKAEDPAAAKAAMAQARNELRDVLLRAFDASQQNQRIEVNRLEAELQAMRGLLDEREAKRDLILQQRFIQLTGQQMPAGPTETGRSPTVAP